MTIRIPFSSILFDLFPEAQGKKEHLPDAMRVFYTVRGVVPQISFDGDETIVLHIDAEQILGRERQFREAVTLCEKGSFDRARTLLQALSIEDPTNSEYHRMLGQIASVQGNQDVAIDHLIDALRWDPKNKHALTMMGNIWAREKNDVDTALRYYEASLVADPKDHLAANNIAVQFMQRGEWKTAGEWFVKAMSIDPEYPNTHHGIAMVALQQGDVPSAFYEATEALRFNHQRDELYRQSLKLAQDTAKILTETSDGRRIVEADVKSLAEESGYTVQILEDSTIPTAAKLEVAENYGRTEHVVRFKTGYPCVEHLQLHELYHLRLIIHAREQGMNELFIMRPPNKEKFIRSLSKHVHLLHRQGFSEDSIANYTSELFDGLNRQIFNAPVDLFIEYEMHRDHLDMRPYQFRSLAILVEEALLATKDKRIVSLSPPDILSKSKVYNLTLAMLYQELFGVDRIPEFKATPVEIRQATKFYEEFKEYREDRQPGEEYEVVRHWAEDLQLTDYFELVKEVEYRKESITGENLRHSDSSLEDQLNQIESDPLDQFRNDPEKAREMKTFLEGQKAIGLNMAVAMFMVDALQYFKGQPATKIKEAAFEIAMLGTQGIHPEKKGYKLSNVPGKTFSGYHLLAYYYVSWKLAIPEMLAQLQLPYDREYETALQFMKIA